MPIISSLKIDISVTVAALAHSAAMRALSLTGEGVPVRDGAGARWYRRRFGAAPGGRPRPVRPGASGRPDGALGGTGGRPRPVRAGASGGTGGRPRPVREGASGGTGGR